MPVLNQFRHMYAGWNTRGNDGANYNAEAIYQEDVHLTIEADWKTWSHEQRWDEFDVQPFREQRWGSIACCSRGPVPLM